ncbi:MAG: hypothetical protein LBH90_07290 [Tannerella sp.]|jgi:hypothetical protein|nr:hypothetical protein [Tannerella sp.]
MYKMIFQQKYLFILSMFLLLISCSEKNIQVRQTIAAYPPVFPDYINVTIPKNIAPLHFKLTDSCVCEQARAIFEIADERIEVKAKDKQFAVSPSLWKKLMKDTPSKTITVTIVAKVADEWISYQPFSLHVADETIDPYIAYRLIEPGYEVWNEMGIYQRCLENYKETPVITNQQTQYNCMNCHSFCMQDPDRMLFHMRATFPGTLLIQGDKIEKLNTKTDQTASFLVYPSWHPSGKYVAFSVNDTKQAFHTTDPNRIEVYDNVSDVVVYDVEKHEIITSPFLFSQTAFETFPTFSPDGTTLYFCTSDSVRMPQKYTEVKYDLCAISFDPERRQFGSKADTLFHARSKGKSVSFPRVSPNGKFLMFTLSGYGNFSIWHKDADLYLLNLATKQVYPLDTLNSSDVESYHSWSSNSHWIVFSSRRIDGLYTRPFIAYIDSEGNASKPFLLPQEDIDFYLSFMKSYNIPEFVTGKVKHREYAISRTAMNDEGIDVKFKSPFESSTGKFGKFATGDSYQ